MGQIKIQSNFVTVIHVAENIDLRPGAKTKLKKGIRGWSKRTDNRRAFSAVIHVAVNYFGLNPINPEAGFGKLTSTE
ncbi:hypothetical protein ACLB1R_35515 [Escherichia coli]